MKVDKLNQLLEDIENPDGLDVLYFYHYKMMEDLLLDIKNNEPKYFIGNLDKRYNPSDILKYWKSVFKKASNYHKEYIDKSEVSLKHNFENRKWSDYIQGRLESWVEDRSVKVAGGEPKISFRKWLARNEKIEAPITTKPKVDID